jgi:hypothetical protein
MPNAGVHLLLAHRVLGRWSRPGADAPFPAGEPRLVRAFLHGSILPDAGYFPRADRLFSELAHLWRTGDLARALVDGARTPAQRAFAWGWVAHVLGDLALHPRINAAHGERLHGSRERPVTSTEDEAGHMRLEYGLDAAVWAAHPELERMGVPAPPGADALEPLARAYAAVFGWAPAAGTVLAASRQVVWAVRMVRLVNRIFTARPARRPLHALVRLGAARLGPPRPWLPERANRSSAAQALLSPLAPPRWLVNEVAAVADGFGTWIDELRGGGLAGLPNHDLVTGEAVSFGAPPPRTEAALRALQARGGAPLGAPAAAVAG